MTTISGEVKTKAVGLLSEYLQKCEMRKNQNTGIVREAYAVEVKSIAAAIDALMSGAKGPAMEKLHAFGVEEASVLRSGVDPNVVAAARRGRIKRLQDALKELGNLP